MNNYLKELCLLNAPSGREDSVRDYIIQKLPKNAEYSIDALGNLLVCKKGKQKPKNKIMLDAHMDEVGFIVTGITPDGFLRFTTVGGIEGNALISRGVVFNNNLRGIICSKPVHQMSDEDKKSKIEVDSLYIDIGAHDICRANKLIAPGDMAVFDAPFVEIGDECILSKALDDRIGCAVLLDLLNSFDEYDYTVCFSVQEEVGSRGARVAAYSVEPDYAIVLEATTAADIEGVSKEKSVCSLKDGPAVSFMDGSTLYDKELYNEVFSIAKENDIKCQPKSAVTGGNNSGGIHLARGGVKTVALSAPCRYIHSASCVSSKEDIFSLRKLTEVILKKLCER